MTLTSLSGRRSRGDRSRPDCFPTCRFRPDSPHEKHQPDFPQRRESLSTAFRAALVRNHMSPPLPSLAVTSTRHPRTHSASVSSRRLFVAGSLAFPAGQATSGVDWWPTADDGEAPRFTAVVRFILIGLLLLLMKVVVPIPHASPLLWMKLRHWCELLSDAPRGFPPVLRYERLNIRWRPQGDYLIFYRVLNDTVGVRHGLHDSRDLQCRTYQPCATTIPMACPYLISALSPRHNTGRNCAALSQIGRHRSRFSQMCRDTDRSVDRLRGPKIAENGKIDVGFRKSARLPVSAQTVHHRE
jgi:plasmid stabilization system protein ParE